MSIRENIHNYYEKMVTDILAEHYAGRFESQEQLADIACIALNHLPPRYYRHEIDMAFYISPNEHHDMETKVRQAVEHAIEYLEKHQGQRAE